MGITLVLYKDRLAAGATVPLLPGPRRVLYVEEGCAAVSAANAVAALGAGSAWTGGAGSIAAGPEGAQVLRFELAAGGSMKGALLASPPFALDPRERYLLRCDRVEFPPGGCAYRHVHQGPGLRCLVAGTISIETGGETHRYAPGEAWFERGPDPVFAAASATETTAFIRVMVLPRALLGKSSIRYLDEADRDKPRVQRYRIYFDEPIALPEEHP